MRPRPRLLVAVTEGLSARVLMSGQLRKLRERGFDVMVAANPGPALTEVAALEAVSVHGVPMRRTPAPMADLVALARLHALCRRWRPDLVSASTPKAALLAIIAGWLAGVPARVYVVRGLRLETKDGISGRALALVERLTAAMATDVVAVSASLRKKLDALHLVPGHRVLVLGNGSSNGVDVTRFRPACDASERADARRALGLDSEGEVIGFVGRLTRDKGLEDLLQAFVYQVKPSRPNRVRLVLAGSSEHGDGVPASLQELARRHPLITMCGFVPEPSSLYRAFDVLAFPSYREGLPNVPLEASASAVPVVGYAATGTIDAVVDGRTGQLVPLGDVGALSRGLLRYLEDPDLASRHGRAGRERACALFAQERVQDLWVDYYWGLVSRSLQQEERGQEVRRQRR